MRNSFRGVLIATGVAAVVSLAVVPAVLRGQAPAGRGAAPAAARVPRTADGKPNLNGIWQVMVNSNWNLEDHGASAGPFYQLGATGAVPAGQGIVEGGDIPYTPAAQAKRDDNARNRLTLDPEVKCYMPGIPRATYMPFPFQIVQSPQNILFAYEYASANRVVNMGKPTEAPVDSWMGWSNGKWEGDTLVVDVTGLNGNAWLDRAGNYTTDTTHVVERYHADRRRPHQLRGDDRGREALHEALEAQHGALQAHREELPAARVQVRGVLRGDCSTATCARSTNRAGGIWARNAQTQNVERRNKTQNAEAGDGEQAVSRFAFCVFCFLGLRGRVRLAARPRVKAAPAATDWFTDKAKETGLDFVHFNGMSGEFYYPEIMPPESRCSTSTTTATSTCSSCRGRCSAASRSARRSRSRSRSGTLNGTALPQRPQHRRGRHSNAAFHRRDRRRAAS